MFSRRTSRRNAVANITATHSSSINRVQKTGEEISDQVECGSVPPGSTRAGPTAWT
jgi:hypothetical protein